jgi:PAS domain S-box-containing protein
VPNIAYDHVIADVQHVLDTLEIRTAEVYTRDTGEWYWMRISPYRTTENIIEGVVLTFSNITDQKEAYEKLRKLTSAVEQSSSMIIITNTQGIIEYVNPQFTRITGYTADEIIGQELHILKADQPALDTHKQAWQIIMSGQEWHGEFQNRKKNGEIYRVVASRAPIRNEQGEITHFIAVEDDITQRRQYETDLHISQQLLSSIYNGIEIPMLVIDVTPDGRFHYVGTNPAFERIVGFPNALIQHKYLEELETVVGTEGVARLRKRFSTVVETGESLEYEQMSPTPTTRSEGWWLVHLQPIKDEQGHVYRIVATTQSITHQKRIETIQRYHSTLLTALGTWWKQIIEHQINEQQALEAMSRLLIESSLYAAAWVGLIAQDRPEHCYAEAFAGEAAAYTRLLEKGGFLPIQQAMTTQQKLIIQDIGAEPQTESWRTAALHAGYHALLVLPFEVTEHLAGFIAIYATTPHAWRDEIINILVPLTTNLVNGLHILQHQKTQ